MSDYRRAFAPGGAFFFTANLANRKGNDLLLRKIGLLRNSVASVRARHPFEIVAAVIMPEHLHMIWQLPQGDADFAMRWSLIKGRFSCSVPSLESRSISRVSKRERGIWQRRYWEHRIRDDEDMRRHVEYIHYNPVKHGYVSHPLDWPCSSFHRYVRKGIYPADWAASAEIRAWSNE